MYKNTKLIDGGIRENVPWKELKLLGADQIINVIFEEQIDAECCDNIINVIGRSINLLCRELSNYEMEGSDITVKINCKKIGLLDMNKIDELYEIGYDTMRNIIDNDNRIVSN